MYTSLKMVNKYYQKNKEKLCKEARKWYQNISEEEKEKSVSIIVIENKNSSEKEKQGIIFST